MRLLIKKGFDLLVTKVMLNERLFLVNEFKKSTSKNGDIISFTFEVKSEDYHDVTTLLYEGKFLVELPEKDEKFTGTIQEYSTSVTNLYESGNVGVFKLSLLKEN